MLGLGFAGPGGSAFVLGQHVRDEGVGAAMARIVLLLQPAHQLHVPGRRAGAEQRLPFGDRAAIFLLDRGGKRDVSLCPIRPSRCRSRG